ncbi:MAG: DNA recombination protein RmuC [Candidatus Rokubacteria bacterium]|nr:DNA recombination protein RmuC [Candidatus Rokubacteria bacterium]MBI3826568.1 DNA recombination protein RmuC [Candidatus Rokubacteria bacterium]
MVEATLLVIGAALGGALAWLVARGHFRAAAAGERDPLASRLASAETSVDEARKQLTHRELKVEELQSTLDAERLARAQADARLEAAHASLDEQRRFVEQSRERLADTFKALSADALQQNSAAFVDRARETLGAQLERGREAIASTVQPLSDALTRYEQDLRALEASRQHAYSSLGTQLGQLAASSASLQRETGNLVTALRGSQVRGKWGELTLRRAVEVSGMTQYCDYVEQVTVEGEGGRLRPDMVVNLPAGRQIVVDAKVPLEAYLDAAEAKTPEDRAAALGHYAQQVRRHVGLLASKAYWTEFASAADFVIMFMPGEAFFAAAADADGSLIEEALGKRVIVASPMSLVALLRAVEIGWRQQRLAANAAEISRQGHELYERIRLMTEHFAGVGRALGGATKAFNQAVGSFESRVLPAVRRFRELGAAGGDEIEVLEAVDQQPRALTAPEATGETP